MSEPRPRKRTLRIAFSALRLGVPVALGIALCAGVVVAGGHSPWLALHALVSGALGSRVRLAETAAQVTPLIFTGLSVAIAFRAGFFNIGAEGQFFLGAVAATAIGTKTGLTWPFAALAGAAAGSVWALMAGWLKLARGAPEIITTIMLNYVAIYLVKFLLLMPPADGQPGGWLLRADQSQPQSDVISQAAQVPTLVAGTSLSDTILVALAVAVLCWWVLFRTARGLLWRAAGAGPRAASVMGIAAKQNAYMVIALSGALSGLGGALELAGDTHQLNTDPFGYGYTAIAVALLANLNPLGVIPAACVFGILQSGGGAMERDAQVPMVATSVIIGVVIFLLAMVPRLRAAREE